MDRPTMAQMLQHGMPGTPGGPVQESPTMDWMRDKQMIRGLLQAGVGLPIGYAGVSSGSLPFALGGAALTATGMDNITNSYAPNIRDVYDDQLRMKMQGN
jgi:hypothetical protein